MYTFKLIVCLLVLTYLSKKTLMEALCYTDEKKGNNLPPTVNKSLFPPEKAKPVTVHLYAANMRSKRRGKGCVSWK